MDNEILQHLALLIFFKCENLVVWKGKFVFALYLIEFPKVKSVKQLFRIFILFFRYTALDSQVIIQFYVFISAIKSITYLLLIKKKTSLPIFTSHHQHPLRILCWSQYYKAFFKKNKQCVCRSLTATNSVKETEEEWWDEECKAAGSASRKSFGKLQIFHPLL